MEHLSIRNPGCSLFFLKSFEGFYLLALLWAVRPKATRQESQSVLVPFEANHSTFADSDIFCLCTWIACISDEVFAYPSPVYARFRGCSLQLSIAVTHVNLWNVQENCFTNSVTVRDTYLTHFNIISAEAKTFSFSSTCAPLLDVCHRKDNYFCDNKLILNWLV